MPAARLERTILRLSGDGVHDWLSGLITNSLTGSITFAALLTPQGKIISDFFVTQTGDTVYLDAPRKMGEALFKRLKMYRLRAKIDIEDISDSHAVYAFWDTGEWPNTARIDPRLAALGHRLISSEPFETAGDYDAHRLSLGVPDSAWDFDSAQVFPADANMDILHGVDFKKGCFIGQEVVSRMKRMTTVKKRMQGLTLSPDTLGETGDPIKAGGRVVGTLLYRKADFGMGLIRLDRLDAASDSPTLHDQPVEIHVLGYGG